MAFKDPEKAHVYYAAYRAAHREEHAIYAAAYYAAHPEKARALTAAWRMTHPEEARAYLAIYRVAHQKERRAYTATHREEIRAAAAAYQAAHPERSRESAHRRRARLRSQFAAPVNAAAIYVRDRGRCHICGKRVKQTEASMDHLIPISLGGIHAPSNVALAHLKCNIRRNNRGQAQSRLAL